MTVTNEQEQVVCDFLRKLCPSRDWTYLGEVEHLWIAEMVGAITATVGAGTCHDPAETPSYRDKTEFKCSECGYEYSAVGGFGCEYGDEPDFNFCPNCGKKVVSEWAWRSAIAA